LNFVDIINFNDDNSKTSSPYGKNKGKQKVLVNLNCVEIKSKKPRQPNWENVEILAFIKGKKTKHEASLIVVDFRNMETSITKWKHISTFFMPNGHSKHFHNGTCNNKWGSFYGDYKKIIDYMGVIGHNEDYWEMSTKDKVT
jgi:hypothetical protein